MVSLLNFYTAFVGVHQVIDTGILLLLLMRKMRLLVVKVDGLWRLSLLSRNFIIQVI